jgi:hypothetical protein
VDGVVSPTKIVISWDFQWDFVVILTGNSPTNKGIWEIPPVN